MARSELDIFPSKRHDKLEFFLKRHLEESVFNKIRMYEACIVVSERKSKKAFEYVILTDECIYLTQNPPKTIHEAVHLNDVVAIELVDDYPDFLSGQDRESAQHIRIVSITRAEKKGHKVQVRGNKYLPAVISGRRKFGALSQEEAVVSSNIQEGSSISKSKQGRALNQFSLRGNAAESGEPHSTLRHTASFPTSALKNLKLSDRRNAEGSVPTPPNARPLPDPPKESAASHSATTATAYSSVSMERLATSPFPSNWNMKEPRPDTSPEAGKAMTEQAKPRESELHLYIISMTSLIFLHLRSAWNNQMIQSTLLQDPAYARVMAPFSPSRGPKTHSSEETNKLFNQLSSELLHGNNFLERSFSLVQELKMAALRNFTIKKLFWKSNDLYPFLISKLQEHLPKFENPISQQDKRKMAGHLQFSILIVETLGVMFRETETEPTRLTLLNANRGMTVMNLLKILISGPQIPTPAGTNVPTVSEISTNSQDGELQKLLLEYNNAVTTVVYEIFLITHQGNWGSASGNLTVGWLMVALKKLPSMLPFIDQMMKHIIKMVLPPIHIMSPTQALQLFQQFYILNTCIQYSSDLAEHIRNKYSEEFRYYIQTATVEAMLPVHYAVAQPTIRLLRQVLSFVLHKLI
ncbi:uncharacterized protein C12orf56 homolog isoform X1 [Chiloscyllium plagiosum]|uniref:uncharacterized protein C12orf56 homolog isoform X1 n=1 Tax=Chiloscyllium plagiosum TaxID=36176 RepID=UPI001CB87C56|nr:uncharacterized protein C12orf56 homolog isoform X1 [Chiloscyllium plagiosum]